MMKDLGDWVITVVATAVIAYLAAVGCVTIKNCDSAAVVTDLDAEYHERYCGRLS